MAEDAAGRTIVVVVVGRATAAAPIFVAATGFFPASIFVRFAADARIADASRFAPAPALFSRSALSAFSFSAAAAAAFSFSFSAAAAFAAASSAWDSFRTRDSQSDFTAAAWSFTLVARSAAFFAASSFSFADFLASGFLAGGAYFWSLETAFPNPVFWSAATDMGILFRVISIFRIRDDLYSVLAVSSHALRMSRPFLEMNSRRSSLRVWKITRTTNALSALFITFFIIHTRLGILSTSFTPPASSSMASRFCWKMLGLGAAGSAGLAGDPACFAFFPAFFSFSFSSAAFALAFFVALSLFAAGAAGSNPLG